MRYPDFAHAQSGGFVDINKVGARSRSPQFYVLTFLQETPSTLSIPQARKGEAAKIIYEQRVREVELGSFTPLIFSTSGGMEKSTAVAYKRLASLLANKRDQPYSVVMAWLRCHLSFSLLRSAITCLRGARSTTGHASYATHHNSIDLAVSEGRIPLGS